MWVKTQTKYTYVVFKKLVLYFLRESSLRLRLCFTGFCQNHCVHGVRRVVDVIGPLPT